MNSPLPKSDNPLFNVMSMYADQLSDANIADVIKNNYTELLSERPNDPIIKQTIEAANARLNTRNASLEQTKQFILKKHPKANFAIAAQMERSLFASKQDSMIESALSKLKSIVREAILTDVQKTEFKQSYVHQQNPDTKATLQKMRSTTIPQIKESMQDAITDLRGAGLSKLDVSAHIKQSIQNNYVGLMKDAIVAHERAMMSDDPEVASDAAEKLGYIGESAINKNLNPTTIRLQASEELVAEKDLNKIKLVQQAKELAGTALNQGFLEELMKLKKNLGQENMTLSDVVEKLPSDVQVKLKQTTQKMQFLDDARSLGL